MISITFKVEPDFIARYMIKKSKMPRDFANFLWNKYNCSYISLQKNMQSNNIDLNILKELKEQDFFIETLEKAKENLKRIEKNWGLNKEKINNILFKLMKTQFDLHTTCFVLSPELNGGHHLGNFSFIWGHEMGLKNPNYDLVYLVHESLHSYFNSDDLSHAIIENIADIELSKLLDQTNICRYDTHPFLQELHAKILPFWNLYLNHNKSEISKEDKF